MQLKEFLLSGFFRWVLAIVCALGGTVAVWAVTLFTSENANSDIIVVYYVAAFAFGAWVTRRFIRAGIQRLQLQPLPFAERVYRAAEACAITVIHDCSDVPENQRFAVTIAFLQGLLHAIDRKASEVIPTRRSEVMDGLVVRCYGRVINSFSGPDITVAEKRQLLSTALSSYNEVASFYGTCRQVSPKGQESPKGTFLWEFGEQFASAAGHPMDIGFITLGSGLLLETIMRLKISDELSSL